MYWTINYIPRINFSALRGRLPQKGKQYQISCIQPISRKRIPPPFPTSESSHANFNNHWGFLCDFGLKKLLCSLNISINISKSIQITSTVIIVWYVFVYFTRSLLVLTKIGYVFCNANALYENLEVLWVTLQMTPPARKTLYLKYFTIIENNGYYLFYRPYK